MHALIEEYGEVILVAICVLASIAILFTVMPAISKIETTALKGAVGAVSSVSK